MMRSYIGYGHIRTRVVVAVALAVIGLSLAGRSLWPLIRTHDHDALPAPLTEVAAGLGSELLDTTPVRDSPVESIVVRAQDIVAQELLNDQAVTRVVAVKQRQDLVVAFGERLVATLDGQYDRDMHARVERGMAAPEPASRAVLDKYEQTADWTRHSRVGLRHIEVRIIYDGGRPVAPNPVLEGYEALSYTKKGPAAFPISNNPEADGLDVVEIRLPMGLRPIEGGTRGAVLVGYQFAWSSKRGQWIPLRNVIYRAQGERYAALPF